MNDRYSDPRPRGCPDLPIVIVGTGFSGIAMGVELKKAGIDSFVLLEKANDIGGTWRDNTYPGAACDVPSHLYSFSFEPKADWSHAYSPQAEIQDYLRACVEKHDLARHVRFHTEVTGARFDASSGTWTVRLEGQPAIEARALVLGNGALSIPSMPDIPGLADFEGDLFHSARWNHGADLEGKSIAVVGTGASAIQFVPQIAPRARELRLFQRTPPWILPKPDRPFGGIARWLFANVPAARWLYRCWLYWLHELRAIGFVVDPRLMKQAEKMALRHLRAQVPDDELRRKLTPDYTMGCKRILLSNDYYPAVARENVSVVTEGVERVVREGVVTRDGALHRVDAIVCGTGFTATDYLAPLDLRGVGGHNLNDVLQETGESHLGITVSGFPNLFLLMGPNTGLGHNSMVFMIEAQARYACRAVRALLDESVAWLDVLPEVQRASSEQVQARLEKSVWNSGCQSWYLKDGRNASLWPGFTFQYWWRTRRLDLADFHVEPALDERPEREPLPAYSAT